MLAFVAGTVLALATSLAVASAHFVFTAGKYRIAIGWQNEPSFGTDTYVGEQNAIQVFVDIASADNPKGTPVSTLNADCTHPDFQVTVTVGTTTSSPFCPAPAYDGDTGNGRLDEYDYPVIPTVVGTYTFHIFGTINGNDDRSDHQVRSDDLRFHCRLEQRRVPSRGPGCRRHLDQGRRGESAGGERAAERANSLDRLRAMRRRAPPARRRLRSLRLSSRWCSAHSIWLSDFAAGGHSRAGPGGPSSSLRRWPWGQPSGCP